MIFDNPVLDMLAIVGLGMVGFTLLGLLARVVDRNEREKAKWRIENHWR